jgi:nucleoside-diphosphate-sugar epimerase
VKVAVIGATGTVGSLVTSKLIHKGHDVIEVSRSAGVDLISGKGLTDALDGVDVAIDTSNPFPPDASIGLHEALTVATRNVVSTCMQRQVEHLVFLSIASVEGSVFDDFPYYAAKRAKRRSSQAMNCPRRS